MGDFSRQHLEVFPKPARLGIIPREQIPREQTRPLGYSLQLEFPIFNPGGFTCSSHPSGKSLSSRPSVDPIAESHCLSCPGRESWDPSRESRQDPAGTSPLRERRGTIRENPASASIPQSRQVAQGAPRAASPGFSLIIPNFRPPNPSLFFLEAGGAIP